MASHGLVAGLDELDMCTTKLGLLRGHRFNDQSAHLLDTHEVQCIFSNWLVVLKILCNYVIILTVACVKIEPTLCRLQLEKAAAEQELKKLLGQLLYLDNLNKVHYINIEY